VRRFLLFVCLTAAFGSGCRESIVDHVPIDIALPGAPECRDVLGPMTLTALGDFPTTDRVVALLDSSGAMLEPITRFPDETLAFSISGRASTGRQLFGWATRASLAVDAALVVWPVGLSCLVADPEAHAPVGAAVVAIDQARAMFVGGLDESGNATRRIAILHTRRERVELPAVAQRASMTAFGTATLAGDAVIVSGGALRDGGDAQLACERIPLDGSALGFGSLRVARRDHGAIGVDLGGARRVLLVGGSNGRSALASMEWLDPATCTGDMLDSVLATPRVAPLLVQLDANHIAIVGGTPSGGGAILPTLEILDFVHDARVSVGVSLPVPTWIAALPSGRIAWAAASRLQIVSPADAWVADAGTVPTVEGPVATGLLDGRILLEGHRSDGMRLGYVIDPGAGTTTPVATSRVPDRLLPLLDGTTLEIATLGVSLRRDDHLTLFDGPPPTFLFATDRDVLALDASSRWTSGADGLSPTSDGARLDIPLLRFRQLEAQLDASGSYDVLLTGEHLEALATIAVTSARVSIGACAIMRTEGATHVRVARIDGGVSIGDDHAQVSCPLAIDAGTRVGVGIVAHTGASLRSMALTRDSF